MQLCKSSALFCKCQKHPNDCFERYHCRFLYIFCNIHTFLKSSQQSRVAAADRPPPRQEFFTLNIYCSIFTLWVQFFMNTYHAHFKLRKIWKCWKFSYFDMTQVCIFKKNTDRPKFLDKKVFAWVWDVWIRYGVQVKKV